VERASIAPRDKSTGRKRYSKEEYKYAGNAKVRIM